MPTPRRAATRAVVLALVIYGLAAPVPAVCRPEAGPADSTAQTQNPPGAWKRAGYELGLPLGSLFVPGLGQAAQGQWGAAFAYAGLVLAGAVVAVYESTGGLDTSDVPRDPETQTALLGLSAVALATFLSPYDSFRFSLPRLQSAGKYDFLESPPPRAGEILRAPFEWRFLKRPKTIAVIGAAAALAIGVAVVDDGEDASGIPFELHDAVWAAGTSYGAGTGEEAFFRGYLFPYFHQLLWKQFWVSNTLQALLFAAAHFGSVDIPVAQFLFGWYTGWTTKGNGWDFRESVFQHCWWDVIVITTSVALDSQNPQRITFSLPPIRF